MHSFTLCSSTTWNIFPFCQLLQLNSTAVQSVWIIDGCPGIPAALHVYFNLRSLSPALPCRHPGKTQLLSTCGSLRSFSPCLQKVRAGTLFRNMQAAGWVSVVSEILVAFQHWRLHGDACDACMVPHSRLHREGLTSSKLEMKYTLVYF